jgi:F-type H+-transporting ATPase subunit b
MQIISNIALVSINETVIVQLISFLIFLFVINRIMFRPLRDTMLKRDQHINRIQDDITHQENQLQTLKNKIRKRESSVRSEAIRMKKQLEDSGNQEAAAILSTTRQEIENLRKKSALDIENKVSEARKSLEKESQGLVSDVMEKVLDRRLSS